MYLWVNIMDSSEFTTLQSFSEQPTSLIETTLVETLGLSMHNAVSTQQSSQVQGNAAVANTMSMLLSIPSRKTTPISSEQNRFIANSKGEEPVKKESIFSRFKIK